MLRGADRARCRDRPGWRRGAGRAVRLRRGRRTLAGLLGYPAFQVDALVAQGMDGAQALAIGRRHLDRIVMTEVADTARTATGLAIVADRAASG